MTQLALLFTDVVNSTRLTEQLGDAGAAQLWAAHDQRSRELLAHRGVLEIDRTDGFFLAFERVTDAALFAVAYHQAIAGLGMQARAGLHVGPVTLRENAPEDVARGAKRVEIEGLAKPLAARVMGLAQAGQTLMTAAASLALGDSVFPGVCIERHGFYRLKGVEEPVEIHEIGLRDVSKFMPPPDVEKAYRVVRAGSLWMPVRELRHNLPAERDAFVGRIAELRALAARFDEGARLVSVLGQGGTGKTRLVRRYASSWLGDWPGGVYFCDLSEARSQGGIYLAVAQALEVALSAGDAGVQLGYAIAGRGRCLVILDNFEQVIEHAHTCVGRWLDRASEAAFIVTSRERLKLKGEEVFPLEPLALESEAVELFLCRAREQLPNFRLVDANRQAVAEAVQLLDGLPLAIELAAARLRVLSPAQIVGRLRDRFALLTGIPGTSPRQATLRTAIDWSWNLLQPWEQAALAQVSIFEGGFTLEAVESVVELSKFPQAPSIIDVVQSLVDRSLLRTWIPLTLARNAPEEPYFGMYVSIHEYASEKLRDASDDTMALIADRHSHHFAKLGRESEIEALSRHGGILRRRALGLEVGNLVTACRRAIAQSASDDAVGSFRAVWECLSVRGPIDLANRLGAQVLALENIDDSLRAATCVCQGLGLQLAGRPEDGLALLHEALVLASRSGDARRNALASIALARVLQDQTEFDSAGKHASAALEICTRIGDRAAEGRALAELASISRRKGDWEQAHAYQDAALRIAGEVGDRDLEGVLSNKLGNLLYEQGRLAEAQIAQESALAIARETGNSKLEGVTLGNLGVVLDVQGKLEESLGQHSDALKLARRIGVRRSEVETLSNMAGVHAQAGDAINALRCLEEALPIARDSHLRSLEGNVLGNMGCFHSAAGRFEEAEMCCDAAIRIAAELGDVRNQGIFLGTMAQVLIHLGRTGEAKAAVEEGSSYLRRVGPLHQLGLITCILSQVESSCGNARAARTAIEEARSVAARINAGPESDLSRAITAAELALSNS